MKLSKPQEIVIEYLKTGQELSIWRAPTSGYQVSCALKFNTIKKSTIYSLEKKGLICRDLLRRPTHENYYVLTDKGKTL